MEHSTKTAHKWYYRKRLIPPPSYSVAAGTLVKVKPCSFQKASLSIATYSTTLHKKPRPKTIQTSTTKCICVWST